LFDPNYFAEKKRTIFDERKLLDQKQEFSAAQYRQSLTLLIKFMGIAVTYRLKSNLSTFRNWEFSFETVIVAARGDSFI
jgi:hypothetical protein